MGTKVFEKVITNKDGQQDNLFFSPRTQLLLYLIRFLNAVIINANNMTLSMEPITNPKEK